MASWSHPHRPYAGQAISANPDNLRRFWVVQDAEDLREMLEKPLDDWVRFLHPTQREIASGTFNGPVKVTGSAGTGKTVVAMHRAAHLAGQGKRVLVTSFVTTLCENIEHNLDILCSAAKQADHRQYGSRTGIETRTYGQLLGQPDR